MPMNHSNRGQPLLAFSTLGCPDWSFDEIVARGVEYGYDGVEIRLIERETDLLKRPEFRAPQLAVRKRQLADAGFRVCGLSSSVRFEETERSVRDAQLAAGRAYCDLARELGASFVRVFGDMIRPNDDETPQLDWIAMRFDQDVDADRAGILAQSIQSGGNPVELRSLIVVGPNHVAENADETRADFASEIAVRSAGCKLCISNGSLGLFKANRR